MGCAYRRCESRVSCHRYPALRTAESAPSLRLILIYRRMRARTTLLRLPTCWTPSVRLLGPYSTANGQEALPTRSPSCAIRRTSPCTISPFLTAPRRSRRRHLPVVEVEGQRAINGSRRRPTLSVPCGRRAWTAIAVPSSPSAVKFRRLSLSSWSWITPAH
jgi:hypothetical protein